MIIPLTKLCHFLNILVDWKFPNSQNLPMSGDIKEIKSQQVTIENINYFPWVLSHFKDIFLRELSILKTVEDLFLNHPLLNWRRGEHKWQMD